MEPRPRTLRVAHVITGIRPHGAERALLRLVGETSGSCQHHVIVISSDAPMRGDFEAAGATVTVIGLGRRSPNPIRLWQLGQAIRSGRPDVVQTWLPAADLLGGVLGRLFAHSPVVWNLRISEVSRERWGLLVYLVCRVNALLSRVVPRRIVAIGERTAEEHRQLGFDPRRMTIIHNGFVIPEASTGQANARALLGLPDRGPIACRLARYHPDKDVPTLVEAWRRVVGEFPDAVLAFAGRGFESTNNELRMLIDRAGIARSTVLLGELADPAPLYEASDITVSSSLAEGLPNVVGEAMARAVPAIVTDVGDSAALVGDTGRVVPPGDPDALATAISDLFGLEQAELESLGALARQRMQDEFSMDTMATRYTQLWSEVADVRD